MNYFAATARARSAFTLRELCLGGLELAGGCLHGLQRVGAQWGIMMMTKAHVTILRAAARRTPRHTHRHTQYEQHVQRDAARTCCTSAKRSSHDVASASRWASSARILLSMSCTAPSRPACSPSTCTQRALISLTRDEAAHMEKWV